MEKILVIAGVGLLILTWVFGCWVSYKERKEGKEVNNDFGM